MKKLLCAMLSALLLLVPVYVSADTDAVNYEISTEPLLVGTASYSLSTNYEYTVFDFEPDSTGEYTFSISNGKLGIVSNHGMWVVVTPSEETVAETSTVWSCISVGQHIYVAIIADSAEANVTITYKPEEYEETVYLTYENVSAPSKFEFKADSDELLYIDFEDKNVNYAVLGEDGFYHLDSADGPILFVNFDDAIMNLADAVNYGQLKGIVKDGEDEVYYEYNTAFLEYIDCADKDTLLYPLTIDLIVIYKNVGAFHGWYEEDSVWVGGNEGDNWMFACYYDESIVNGEQIKGWIEKNPINDPENDPAKEPNKDSNGASTKDEADPGDDSGNSVLGDINDNGSVDMTDYILAKRAYFGTYQLKMDEFERADVNANNGIDMTDYILIKRVYFGTYSFNNK